MVCQYLRLQYPKVIFKSDFGAGAWLTKSQAGRQKTMQSSRGFPDIFIYEPRTVKLEDGAEQFYSGLAIELKKEGTTIIVTHGERKGHLTSDPHIQEQFIMLKELKSRGYYANFAVGFDEAQKIIDWYMGRRASNVALF